MQTGEELRSTIAEHHLADALAAVEADGRYWFSSSRAGARVLCELVVENGHNVLLHELPPEWEHVIAHGGTKPAQLLLVARERCRLRDQGVSEERLPK